MPFNIELDSKNGTRIKLQCVDTMINIYFDGQNATDTFLDFKKLIVFLYKQDESQKRYPTMIRGYDDLHAKRHHLHTGEMETIHVHIAHRNNITTEDLKYFLHTLLTAQIYYSSEKYKFISSEAVDSILKMHRSYEVEFKASGDELEFKADRILSDDEKDYLEKETKKQEKNRKWTEAQKQHQNPVAVLTNPFLRAVLQLGITEKRLDTSTLKTTAANDAMNISTEPMSLSGGG